MITKSGCSPSEQDSQYIDLTDLYVSEGIPLIEKMNNAKVNETTIVFRNFISAVASLYKLSSEDEGEVVSQNHLTFLDKANLGEITIYLANYLSHLLTN